MTLPSGFRPDPERDLVLEREVDAPPDALWAGWTRPELITRWFTPAPYTTPHCEIDLRPGGKFRTVMRSPEGEEFDGAGCILEVVENRRLVWTSALGPDFRPNVVEDFVFTAIISLEPTASGTRYTAVAMHPDAASREKHAGMGFHEGWGAALDQLVALVKEL